MPSRGPALANACFASARGHLDHGLQLHQGTLFSLDFRRRFRDLGESLLRIRFQFLAGASTNDTQNFGTWQLLASPPLRFFCHVLQTDSTTRQMGFTRLLTCTAPTPISVTARKRSADFPTTLAEVFTSHCFARSQDRPEPAAANEHSKKTCKLDHCDVGDCLLGRRLQHSPSTECGKTDEEPMFNKRLQRTCWEHLREHVYQLYSKE